MSLTQVGTMPVSLNAGQIQLFAPVLPMLLVAATYGALCFADKLWRYTRPSSMQSQWSSGPGLSPGHVSEYVRQLLSNLRVQELEDLAVYLQGDGPTTAKWNHTP